MDENQPQIVDLSAALDINDLPAELCKYGVKVWHDIGRPLLDQGRVKDSDREVVTRYCYLAGRFWDAAAQIKEDGLTIKTPMTHKDGEGNTQYMTRRHPAALDQDKLLPEIRQLEDRLGLSPASRVRLTQMGLRAHSAQGELYPQNGGNKAQETSSPSSFH